MATSKENELRVLGERSAATRELTRREMVQRLLAGASAGAAWPLVAASHPILEHLRNDAIFAEAEKLKETADWKPVFLNAQQNEALMALAESVVPGSTRAHVSRFVDLLLNADKAENQRKFVESLSAMETEGRRRFGKSFPALSEEQKNTLLSNVSTKPANPEASEKESGNKQSALYSHFENLKGWISGAYYSSEVGMRELGWRGEYAFAEFPGCTHEGESH